MTMSKLAVSFIHVLAEILVLATLKLTSLIVTSVPQEWPGQTEGAERAVAAHCRTPVAARGPARPAVAGRQLCAPHCAYCAPAQAPAWASRSSLLQEGTFWLSGGEVWVLRAACCLLSPYALDTEDRAAATHHPLQSEPDWSKAAQGGPFPPTGACSTLAASQWLQPSGGALDPAALALTSSILTSPASPAH